MVARSNVRRVSVEEAAEFLGVSAATLNKLRGAGLGPPWYRPTPRRVIYDLSDLERYLAERRNAPAGERRSPAPEGSSR